MADTGKPLNDSPELRDAIRSIEATHEDESGLASGDGTSGAKDNAVKADTASSDDATTPPDNNDA